MSVRATLGRFVRRCSRWGGTLQAVRLERSGATSKTPKNPTRAKGNAPPPPKNNLTFVSRAASSNRYIAQTLKPSEKILIFTLKYFKLQKKLL